MRRFRSVVVMLAVAGIGAGCGSAKNSPAVTTVKITAASVLFSPTEISLPAGKKAAITMENTDGFEHNLTVEGLKIDEDVEGGKSFSTTVTPKAGKYPFHCEYHPNDMRGTITVS